MRSLPEPILLDEWQEVPSVLGAIKRAVDGDYRPGRFLLTGSVSGEVEQATWPGTGRVVRIPLYGMTVRELRGQATNQPVIDQLAEFDSIALPRDVPDLRGECPCRNR